MKAFKKKRTKLPKPGAVERLLRRNGLPHELSAYRSYLRTPNSIIPRIIREATLAHNDPCKRENISYTPDLRNFKMFGLPNRSLPIAKFFDMFRGMFSNEELDKIIHDMSAYRMELHTTVEGWLDVYNDDMQVASCMSNSMEVAQYVHPENKLALAALYAPGTDQVVARTIVNTEEKWYVRLFGDVLLVNKLKEQGYHRLDYEPRAFKMYGKNINTREDPRLVYPYFDFTCRTVDPHWETYNPEIKLVEVTVNRAIQYEISTP